MNTPIVPASCPPPATGNLRTAAAIKAQAAALAAAAKLRAADDERRQAKRNSLADKLPVEAKVLADLKIEKAAVDGERCTTEAYLGTVRHLATLLAPTMWMFCVVSSSLSRCCWTPPRCSRLPACGITLANVATAVGRSAPP
jgi:hypothetical protein